MRKSKKYDINFLVLLFSFSHCAVTPTAPKPKDTDKKYFYSPQQLPPPLPQSKPAQTLPKESSKNMETKATKPNDVYVLMTSPSMPFQNIHQNKTTVTSPSPSPT